MIATPDSDISHSAEQILSAGTVRSGDIVFHCSGALAADVMACLRVQGASIGSLHPIRSFADPELVVENFEGTFCALEGDHGAIEVLQTICLAIGARLFTLEARAKVLCHAGHVFASNYLVALLDVAQGLYRTAGLPDEVVRGMIEPLARSAVENVCKLGSQRALTGPIVRGEYDVLSEHLRILEDTSPAHATLYRYLAHAALEITRQRGELSEEKLQMITQLVRI